MGFSSSKNIKEAQSEPGVETVCNAKDLSVEAEVESVMKGSQCEYEFEVLCEAEDWSAKAAVESVMDHIDIPLPNC